MAKEFTGVKLYIDWTQAQERTNIATGAKIGDVEGENLAVSMGKISKWFADIENTGIFGNNVELTDTTYTFSSGTDGSFSVTEEGGSAQTVRVLPATTASDEDKVLMIDSTGAPVWTEQAWITNAANDLVHYYRKYNASTDSDKTATTYSASEIDNLVAPKLAIEIVQDLPTTNISKTTIYLKPVSGTGTTNNVYEEWVYINDGTADKWEKIGVQEIDLAGFLKASNVQTGTTAGTIKVKGEGDNDFTEVAVAGWGTAATKDAATAIITSGQDANHTSDAVVPTVKAVYDYVNSTGVSSVSGTTDEIEVDSTTGDVTVSLADILTFENSATTKSVGPAADVTGTNGSTISVPSFTVDTTGRITAVGEQTFTAKDEKVAQTAITDGENKYYPILFGNTGASSASGGAITSASETSAETKKTGRMYVKVSDQGLTTLHADVFQGLAATQATATSDNTLASTEFVHNVADDLLNSKLVEGTNIDLSYNSTNKTTTISVDNTVTSADSNAGFVKVSVNTVGLITGTSDVTASDVKGLSGIDFTGADGTNAGTNGMVPAPTATDNTKYLCGNGTWAALPTGTTSAAGIVQLQDSIDTSTTTALTPNAVKAANYASYDDTGVVIRCVS